MQAVKGADTGAGVGAGFGGIQTLDQTDPVTLKSAAENIGTGAATGATLGFVAPTAGKWVGDLLHKAPTPEVAPGIKSTNPAQVDDAAAVAQAAAAKQAEQAHNLAIAQLSGQGDPLDTPTFMRNQKALPAPRENVGVPIDPNTPEGNVLLNQNKPQIVPTGVEMRPATEDSTQVISPAIPDRRVGILADNNTRMGPSDVIPGQPAVTQFTPGEPEKFVPTPGRNMTDIGAPTASADPAALQKARDLAIAKATGTENVVPSVPVQPSATVDSLIRRVHEPTGLSDGQLLQSINDLITHPGANEDVKAWAEAKRTELTGEPAAQGRPSSRSNSSARNCRTTHASPSYRGKSRRTGCTTSSSSSGRTSPSRRTGDASNPRRYRPNRANDRF